MFLSRLGIRDEKWKTVQVLLLESWGDSPNLRQDVFSKVSVLFLKRLFATQDKFTHRLSSSFMMQNKFEIKVVVLLSVLQRIHAGNSIRNDLIQLGLTLPLYL
jgi:hypothetical protein